MKTKFLFLFLFSVLNIYSQVNIDHRVKINFPGDPERMDTTMKEEELSIFILTTDSEVYMATKLTMGPRKQKEKEFDTKEEAAMYRGILKGQNDKMRQNGYTVIDSNQISIQGFRAYKMTYGPEGTTTPFATFLNLVLERASYSFSYLSEEYYNQDKCDQFLNSVIIKNAKRPKDSSEVKAELIGELIGYSLCGIAFVIFVIGGIWYTQKRNRRQNQDPKI